MLTMLWMRPGTPLVMLCCSGSLTRSCFRNGEPGGYNRNTSPPWRIGAGTNPAGVTVPGAVTAPEGAGGCCGF